MDQNKINNNNLKAEKTFLDKQLEMLNDTGIKDMLLPIGRVEEDEDSLRAKDEKLQEFKDEFDRQLDICKVKAKNLLDQVAKLYLTSEQISKNEYIGFRNQIEEMSLSSLIFQLDTSQKAIYKIQESIHLGNTNSRLPEVLTGLIRVTLDTSKFLHEYLTSIQNSFKSLKEDLEEMDSGGSEISSYSSTTTTFVVRDRKKLITDINATLSELKIEKITASQKSVNTKLIPTNGYSQNIEEAQTIESQTEDSDKEENSNPLSEF